ncbi:MAG: molecular chaperone DnaJ [Coriobacteriia bacterium]|nr:molecular chaperone DnaJ [Coriobacteriia bacterium]
MTATANYYDTLGIKKDASTDEVKKAFRRLARKHHPDAGGDEEKFKEINEAYEVLSDAEKRSQYDQYGQYFAGGVPPGYGAGGGGRSGGGGVQYQTVDMGDLGDLFGSVFSGFGGGGGGGRQARRQPQPQRGRDVQLDLDLTFEQAFSGMSTQVDTETIETCSVCNGSGAKPGTSPTTCPACGGSGTQAEGQGMFGFSRPCPRCGGEGTIIEQPCSACRGQGKVRRRKPVTVNVPAGANDGGKLRFKAKGEPGVNGGPTGDLYVITHIKKHPYYTRDGADVVLSLPISIAEAALGTEVRVPAPDGAKVKLKIPAGTQDDRVFRIRGKGAPHLKGSGSGDLKVKAHIVVPKQLTDAQRTALEQFAAETTEDLRAHIV